MKKTFLLTILILGACSEIPPGAYFNRGEPENLLDASSEVVSLTLASSTALTELSSMIAQDPPTGAELNCEPGESRCMQAKELFDRQGVPTQFAGNTGGVTLIYERVVARDCQQRYIDNSINPYNLHPPTFGCSVTANTVQMVSDKRQFISPSLLDFQDGEKAVQNYRKYLKPADPNAQEDRPMSSPLISGSR
jgi:hypothetical protein